MKLLRTRKFRIVFSVFALLYGVAFLYASFTHSLLPCRFFGVTYLSLLFPVLLGGLLLVILPLSVIVYRNYGWLCLLLLFPAWKNLSAVLGFHVPRQFNEVKAAGQVRILSWNVDAFLYRPYQGPESPAKQAAMVNFIRTANADILCFQDFAETPPEYGKVNVRFLADSLGYPYHYFSQDGINYGTIIFSRLPILDSGRTHYTEKVYPESLAYIDVLAGKDTLRVFNTHLRSMYLHDKVITPGNIGYIEFVKEDTALLFHSNRLQRLEYFDCIHSGQAAIVKERLNVSPHPFVFCADLNSVPSGYVYHRIKDGLNDAFLEAGAGFGGTYHRFSLTLRIDVVLTSPSIATRQYYSPRLDLSNHYPIVTDMQIQ